MHHALRIQEILSAIFGHLLPFRVGFNARDAAALARTCRAFREPALDILWDKLACDLSPLVRCLPEACHRSSESYDFRRSLTRNEWDILRSYTRRIRSLVIMNDNLGIGWQSLISMSVPPMGESLFSNLCHLCFQYTSVTKQLLSLPFPALSSLTIKIGIQPIHLQSLEDSFDSLAKTSPGLKTLYILSSYFRNIKTDHTKPRFIWNWRNLRTVCFQIPLDAVTLAHLSRMPSLTSLDFSLRSTLPDEISMSSSNPPLIFSNLKQLTLSSEFLDQTSRLLSEVRFPVVSDVRLFIKAQPSRQDLFSSFISIQRSGSIHTVQALTLKQYRGLNRSRDLADAPALHLEDLRPYLAFRNLRHINLDIKWKVDLTDSDLLALTSTWPQLETLSINEVWGWSAKGGITPNGLLQLLQTSNLGLSRPCPYNIDVLDSVIEEESVPAIAAFFVGLALPPKFCLRSWHRTPRSDRDAYKSRWKDVSERIKAAVH